jgi:predicted alpha/beta hydrolase family esterase
VSAIGFVRRLARLVGVAVVMAGAPVSFAWGQQDAADSGLVNEVIVVPVGDHSISVLVSHSPGATRFTHAAALFPGDPGRGNLRVEDGEIRYNNQRGNFLVRARRHFLEDGVLTVVVDAPSDQQTGLFNHSFRASARYGEDVRAVVAAINARYGALDWTFAGHSEGAVSAVHAARMAGPAVKRVVLAAALTSSNYQGNGVSFSDVKKIRVPILWVHHKHDPCSHTSYGRAKDFAEDSRSALLTVTGSKNARGDACKPYSEHGFAGMEPQTVKAILAWIRTGEAPAVVAD